MTFMKGNEMRALVVAIWGSSVLGVTGTLIYSHVPDPLAARVAALEHKTEHFDRRINPTTGGAYYMFQVCVGIETEFWCRQPQGQGAAFSVGTSSDRFAGYFEIDGSGPSPTSAIYAANVAESDHTNYAIEAHARNAPRGNVALYAESQYAPLASPQVTPILAAEINGEHETTRVVVVGGR